MINVGQLSFPLNLDSVYFKTKESQDDYITDMLTPILVSKLEKFGKASKKLVLGTVEVYVDKVLLYPSSGNIICVLYTADDLDKLEYRRQLSESEEFEISKSVNTIYYDILDKINDILSELYVPEQTNILFIDGCFFVEIKEKQKEVDIKQKKLSVKDDPSSIELFEEFLNI